MAALETIPTRPFSQAKAELSALMDQVVREHRPAVIERRREAMVALSLPDMRDLLVPFRFEPRVRTGRPQTVATLDELGLVGAGKDVDTALDDLLEELRAYAADYVSRFAFYMQTDRRAHAPYVLRFALTPAEQQRDLLGLEIDAHAQRLEHFEQRLCGVLQPGPQVGSEAPREVDREIVLPQDAP